MKWLSAVNICFLFVVQCNFISTQCNTYTTHGVLRDYSPFVLFFKVIFPIKRTVSVRPHLSVRIEYKLNHSPTTEQKKKYIYSTYCV